MGKKNYLNILKIFCICTFLQFSEVVYCQNLDAHWNLVFAGKNTTTPIFWNGNIYTAGEDKALNCINSKGSFVWRRNTDELPGKFLSISPSGLVYLITSNGNLEVFSSQGLPAWKYNLYESPIFPVYAARDGRCFIIQPKRVICLTPGGKMKWSLPLLSSPVVPPVETGSKDMILISAMGDFLRVSIFGVVLEQHRLKKNVSAIGEAPNGYLMACTDGSISYYKSAGTGVSEIVWQFIESGICKKIFYKNDKVLYLFEDGRVVLKTLTSNEIVWQIKLKTSFAQGVECSSIKNEFNITAKGFGCSITDTGKLKWEKQIPEKEFLPIITENGLLIGITKEFLNAYRVETKILRSGNKKNESKNFYSIVKNDSYVSDKEIYPIFIDSAKISEVLLLISNRINEGRVGVQESEYALQLKTILQNKLKVSYHPQNFSSSDRAFAAELLGKLGSYEYLDILLDEIKPDNDSTVNAGILRGLQYLACDFDGKTIEGINYIIERACFDDRETMKAACDCLAVLIQSGDYETSKAAISMLFSISMGKYSSIIKNYAKQKIRQIKK